MPYESAALLNLPSVDASGHLQGLISLYEYERVV